MDCPDVFGALTGWRKFLINSDAHVVGVKLQSVAIGHVWESGDPGVAVCHQIEHHRRSAHDAPDLACSCGYYAYKARADASAHEQGTVLARVALWGRIAEHVRGYRAERMRIEELIVPEDFPHGGALTHRYQLPITIDQGVPAWTSANPSALSPWNPFLSQLQIHPSILSHQALANYQQNAQSLYQSIVAQPPPYPFVAPPVAAITSSAVSYLVSGGMAYSITTLDEEDEPTPQPRGWWRTLL